MPADKTQYLQAVINGQRKLAEHHPHNEENEEEEAEGVERDHLWNYDSDEEEPDDPPSI